MGRRVFQTCIFRPFRLWMTRKLCFDYVAHDMDWSVGHDFGNFVWGVGKGEPRGCAASGLG